MPFKKCNFVIYYRYASVFLLMINFVITSSKYCESAINFNNVTDRSFFTREGGLVGFGKHHLKIA